MSSKTYTVQGNLVINGSLSVTGNVTAYSGMTAYATGVSPVTLFEGSSEQIHEDNEQLRILWNEYKMIRRLTVGD